MNPERESQIDWRENFERETAERSLVSDEEIERHLIAKYSTNDEQLARHAAFNNIALDELKKEIELTNQQRLHEAKERDRNMVTSRDILDLLRLNVRVTLERQMGLEEDYTAMLKSTCEKLRWAIQKELGRLKSPSYLLIPSHTRLIEQLENLGDRLEKVSSPQATNKERILLVDEIINAVHHAPDHYLPAYIIRDFRFVEGIRDIHQKQIGYFFDRLSEY